MGKLTGQFVRILDVVVVAVVVVVVVVVVIVALVVKCLIENRKN